ncbi:MAG: coproporphyrinogen dehydrogenase HemZ [Wujia sp.]
MILLQQNSQLYNNDLRAMLMAFYPGIKIVEDAQASDSFLLQLRVDYGEHETIMTVCKHAQELLEAKKAGKLPEEQAEVLSADGCDNPQDLQEVEELPYYKGRLLLSPCGYRAKLIGDYQEKNQFRNLLKMASYRLLGQFADRKLPWGDMTGVRPTKVAMQKWKEAGADFDHVEAYYKHVYAVSDTKARLATRVAKEEMQLVDGIDMETSYCLYIGIPFCPSRCLYCSFTSYPIARYQEVAKQYVKTLCKELQYVSQRYKDKKLVAIYMGGGTPTSITHEQIDAILSAVREYFDLSHLLEFTIEAGRPDSITREKLEVMKKHGVSRISINPQTMNDETLKVIGRAHTKAQTLEAFALAREMGFDNINMDLIAGLPGEQLAQMQDTLAEIKRLNPESLTVHSLAIKRAANLNQQMAEYADQIHQDMDAMLDLVNDCANELSMVPYYLYRQKNIGGNLENIGYAKTGCACLYNILIMEEMMDIVAVGAGASTKLVFPKENRVERVENCKSVEDYIERFDEMIARKQKHFDNESLR